MEADEKEAFVAYLEIETEGSCRRGPFFARMSEYVSRCLTLGIRTPRDLLQRLEEVDESQRSDTKKAMRLYAHFKHSVTAHHLGTRGIAACFTRTITDAEAQSLTESFVNFVADDPLCLRKATGLTVSTKRTYRADVMAILRRALCRSGGPPSNEEEAGSATLTHYAAALGHLSLFFQLKHQHFEFIQKPSFPPAAGTRHTPWPAGAAGLGDDPPFSSMQPTSDPITMASAFGGIPSGAAGFAAMSAGSSPYYPDNMGWHGGHGGTAAAGEDDMMMMIDGADGSDNSRPMTTGPPDWGQKFPPASLEYSTQQDQASSGVMMMAACGESHFVPAPSASLTVAHGGSMVRSVAETVLGTAAAYAVSSAALAVGRYGMQKVVNGVRTVRAQRAGGPILWEAGEGTLTEVVYKGESDVLNVAASACGQLSWPVNVSCSIYLGDESQPGTLTVNGMDPRAVRRDDVGYDLATSAMVAWSWVRGHEAVLVRFMGTPHAIKRPLRYARVWLTLHPDTVKRTGPSAAAAMAVAIVAKMWGRIIRMDRAMTGDLDLKGRILEVGMVAIKSKAFRDSAPGFQLLCPRGNSAHPQPAAGGMAALTPVDTIWHALEQLLDGDRPAITPEAAMAMSVRDDVVRRGFAEAATVLRGSSSGRQLVQVVVLPGFGRVFVSGGDAVVMEGLARTAFLTLADGGAEILQQALGQDGDGHVLLTEVGEGGNLKPVVDVHFHLPYLSVTTGLHWAGATMAVALAAALARREVRPDTKALACLTGHGRLSQLGKQPLTVYDVEVLLAAGFRRVILPVMPQPNHQSLQEAAARGLEVLHAPLHADTIRLSLLPAAAPQPPPQQDQQPPPQQDQQPPPQQDQQPPPQQDQQPPPPPPPPPQPEPRSLRSQRSPPPPPPPPGRGAPRGRGRRGRKGKGQEPDQDAERGPETGVWNGHSCVTQGRQAGRQKARDHSRCWQL